MTPQTDYLLSKQISIKMKTPEKTVVNNLLFVLCDVIECLLIDAEKLHRIDKQEFKHQSKKDFKTAVFHLQRFLSSVRDCPIEMQEQFGKDADEYKEMLLLYTDRANDNGLRTKLFRDYLINTSSLLDFDFKKVGIKL